jgi:Ca2+-binding EF-hand superfamily protein
MYTPRSIDELPGYNIAARAQSEEDNAMFNIVDADGKGYFTFDEFLSYTNESHTTDVAEYFNK